MIRNTPLSVVIKTSQEVNFAHTSEVKNSEAEAIIPLKKQNHDNELPYFFY